MCGIVGIVGISPVNQQIYDALTVLQHRGQDAAGIMTAQEGELFLRKDIGLVRDVFQQQHMLQLKGNVGIGHVRYPTAGCDELGRGAAFLRQLALSASVSRTTAISPMPRSLPTSWFAKTGVT